MLARASGTIPTYTPSLYLPGSMGRYRQYPRVVKTSIPGAGVKAGKMVWGEQVLNLWGAPRVPFSTARVPLLGLGQWVPPAGCGAGSWNPLSGCWRPELVAAGGFVAGAMAMHLLHRYHLMGMR